MSFVPQRDVVQIGNELVTMPTKTSARIGTCGCKGLCDTLYAQGRARKGGPFGGYVFGPRCSNCDVFILPELCKGKDGNSKRVACPCCNYTMRTGGLRNTAAMQKRFKRI